MDDKKATAPETIRLLLELDRADDPLLYDDLGRFKKGTKRVTRLRLLAHDGALNQTPGGSRQLMSQPVQVLDPPALSQVYAPGAADVFLNPIADGGGR